MRTVNWYFDFVSPFSYLSLHRLKELPPGVAIAYRPVLFAGLLNHCGQKGPAEIAPKRRYAYRWCQWSAARLGIPFRFPAAHPFNPLAHLRLAIAAGCSAEAVSRIFDSLWTTGADPADPAAFAALAASLGVDEARLGALEVKDAHCGEIPRRPPRAASSVCRPSRRTASCSGAPTRSSSCAPGSPIPRRCTTTRCAAWTASPRARRGEKHDEAPVYSAACRLIRSTGGDGLFYCFAVK